MATAQKEIPIDDAELDDLMAQLEEETKGVVDAPSATAAPAPAADDDDLAGLDAELDAAIEATGATAAGPSAEDLAEIAAAADETEQLMATAANAAHLTKSMAQAAAGKITKFDPPENVDDAPFEPDPKEAAAQVEDELAALAAELNEKGEVSTDDSVALAQAEAARRETAEADAAAALLAKQKQERLEADLAAAAAKVKATPAPAPKPTPTPIAIDEEVAHPNPTPAPAATRPPKSSHLIDPAEFKRETRVSMTNLDECMIEQSSLRAYYGTLAADAEAEHAKLKLRHDIIEARVYDKHRKALADAGEKVTEKMVENAVKQDPEWAQSKLRVIEAEQVANRNRACVDSLKDRKDMLVQLGADRREEGKGQVRILEAAASHEDKRAAAMAALQKRS